MRSRNQRAHDGGNFGAPPNPPRRSSNCPRRLTSASVRVPGLGPSWAFHGLRALLQGLGELRGLALDVAAPLAVGLGDALEHVAERGHAAARLGRVVGAAVERRTRRCQEHGHRPAAVPRQREHRLHVDRVEVRALLAVDLDRDEEAVHQLRGRRILEALVLHHVAPVAGGVADREQDRPVELAGAGERLLAPRVPVDRVAGVLQEVGARLGGEAVHGHGTVP